MLVEVATHLKVKIGAISYLVLVPYYYIYRSGNGRMMNELVWTLLRFIGCFTTCEVLSNHKFQLFMKFN